MGTTLIYIQGLYSSHTAINEFGQGRITIQVKHCARYNFNNF